MPADETYAVINVRDYRIFLLSCQPLMANFFTCQQNKCLPILLKAHLPQDACLPGKFPNIHALVMSARIKKRNTAGTGQHPPGLMPAELLWTGKSSIPV
jgi:hypothetical protein